MRNCHTFCSARGVLLEVVDLAVDAPKYATVTHVALPEGCCWRCLTWPWVLQSVQLSHILLSQRGAVGESCSGLGCSRARLCHAFCSLRGVLLEAVALDRGAPKCTTVAHFGLPEGCCWRPLMWSWVLQSVQLSRILLSQRGAVGGS